MDNPHRTTPLPLPTEPCGQPPGPTGSRPGPDPVKPLGPGTLPPYGGGTQWNGPADPLPGPTPTGPSGKLLTSADIDVIHEAAGVLDEVLERDEPSSLAADLRRIAGNLDPSMYPVVEIDFHDPVAAQKFTDLVAEGLALARLDPSEMPLPRDPSEMSQDRVRGALAAFASVGIDPSLGQLVNALGIRTSLARQAIKDLVLDGTVVGWTDPDRVGSSVSVLALRRLAADRHLTKNHKHLHRLGARDGWLCRYCRTPLACACSERAKQAVSDHVMPRSRGGSDGDENRALACVRCNQEKLDQTPDEWGGPSWLEGAAA